MDSKVREIIDSVESSIDSPDLVASCDDLAGHHVLWGRLRLKGNKTYEYDGNNNCLKVTTDTITRYYIYDSANNLIAEASGTEPEDIDRYYVHGIGLNQMIDGGQSYTYHFSSQGHTLAMTDNQETLKNQYAYSPFGRS